MRPYQTPVPPAPPKPVPETPRRAGSAPHFTPPRQGRHLARALRSSLLVGFLVFVGLLLALGGKSLLVAQRIGQPSQDEESAFQELGALTKNLISADAPESALRQSGDGRINILLLGHAGTGYPGSYLTDTIILASIDTKSRRVGMLSLPRDLYVEIPETGTYTKINALYQYGRDRGMGAAPLRRTVEEITGQEIHYQATINFDGFRELVDAMDGVRVEVPYDIYDPRYPGPHYSYETFALDSGWHTLDGDTALKYVRERHTDPQGDFGRAKRQQQVLQALKAKAFSLGTLLNPERVNGLLEVLGENVTTDATLAEMQSFLAMSRRLDTQNIQTLVVDAWQKESLLRSTHRPLGGRSAFVLVPRSGNWNEVQRQAALIFDTERLKREREAIESEAPTLRILVRSESGASRLFRETLEERGFDSSDVAVSVVSLPAWPEESILVDRSNGEMPFAKDTLLKTWKPSEHVSIAGLDPESASDADFTLLVGSRLESELPDDGSYGVPPEPLEEESPLP